MLSEKTKEALKSALMKLGIYIPVTEKPVVKLEDVTLKDNTVLSVDKLEVGANATFTGADGITVPAEDEYEAADGSVIICAGGVITEIKPAEADTQPEADTEMSKLINRLSAVEETLKSMSASKTNLEVQLAETKKALSVSLEAIEQINENSVALNLESKKPEKKEIDYSKLTQYQLYQLDKYGEIRY